MEGMEDEVFESDLIAESTTMDQAKKLACEGLKKDSDFYKGGFAVIKVFYQTHLKRVHYLETKENRPLDYFDLECFVDPKNEEKRDFNTLSAATAFRLKEQDQFLFNELMSVFNVTKIDMPQGCYADEELSNTGENIGNTVPTTIPVSSDGLHYVSDEEEVEALEHSS